MPDLLILTQDFPPDVGGTQTYAAEIARGMSRKGRVRVIAPARPGSDVVDAAEDYEIVRVGGGHNLFALACIPSVRTAVSNGFSRIFCVQWTAALAARLATSGSGAIEIHVAAHGRELLFNPLPGIWSGAYDALRHHALDGATALYPVSRYTSGLLRDLGLPADRIHVVPNGTDPRRFRPADGREMRRRLGLSRGPVLLSVCRLVSRKGIDTVIRALGVLHADTPDASLVVVGDGPERSGLETLANRLGLGSHVRFLGSVGYDDLPGLFAAADVFALVPRESHPDVEGFGLVYLEAGACGVPVVGARTGGIPDAVLDGVTGLLVPPDDPEALAAALHYLVSDPDIARSMGDAGRNHVLERGNWDRVVDRLLMAFEGS